LGGIAVPAPTRAEILRELEGWAEEEFGGLDQEFESEETYDLNLSVCRKNLSDSEQ
jgi:hypothetical protein